MFWRALLLLALIVMASIALTWVFGAEVLLALGLILTQLKVIGQKLAAIQTPAVLIWLKTQTAAFFRLELLKKYFMTTMLPLTMGSVLRKRLAALYTRFKTGAARRYRVMMGWYGGLGLGEQIVAGLILIFMTLGLSVTSIGLWVVLFSVKLPFMIAAGVGAIWRILWTTLAKMAFKAAAFLQLGLMWRGFKRLLPESYLERKRRWDFRVARAVVRRRRLTLRQLHDQKRGLSMRFALIAGYFRQPRPELTELNEASEEAP